MRHAAEPRAGVDAVQQGLQTRRVVEGQRIPADVRRPGLLAGGDAARPADDRVMADHASLRPGGGPGRVEDQRVVGDADRFGLATDILEPDGLGEGLELAAIEHARRGPAAEQHDLSQRGRARQPLLGGVAVRQPRQRRGDQGGVVDVLIDDVAGQQHPVIGVGHDVGELVGAIPGVDRTDDRAGQRRAEDRLDHVDAVGHQDADVVAATHAQRVEATGHPPGTLGQLAAAAPLLGEHDGVPIGRALRGIEQQPADRGRLNPDHPHHYPQVSTGSQLASTLD